MPTLRSQTISQSPMIEIILSGIVLCLILCLPRMKARVTAKTVPAGFAPLFAVTLAAPAYTPQPSLPTTLLAACFAGYN